MVGLELDCSMCCRKIDASRLLQDRGQLMLAQWRLQLPHEMSDALAVALITGLRQCVARGC
jgi:hypothetical protein